MENKKDDDKNMFILLGLAIPLIAITLVGLEFVFKKMRD